MRRGVALVLVSDALGNPTGFDGQFLKAFDFEAHGGQGEIDTTPDEAEAMTFDTMGEALAYVRRSPVCKPLRHDGKPNRPLTATTWELRWI